MTRVARRTFALWLLAVLVGSGIVWNSRFSTDMSFFLPARPSVEQQVLIDQLKRGVVSRLLMIAIAGGDERQRASQSRDLRRRLAKLSEIASVQNGEAESFDAERDFLFSHRYLLSPAVTPERFTVDGLRAAISDSIDRLASPAGLMFKTLLPRDPTGELFALIGSFDAGARPASRAGVWASRDGQRALLLVQTRALGSDTDGQEDAIRLIRETFAVGNAAGLSLTLSGPGVFAVKARATIKEEVARLSAISALAIVTLLFFFYRSPRLLMLGLLPVVSGALAGIVAVSLLYGTVFGITVGFGSALIGEAIDYSIYYFVQSGRLGVAIWRERFWPTVRLGVLTSLCGFGALLFSGFPGLAQLGLYALTGVATAALVTRFVLPPLAGDDFIPRDVSRIGRALDRAVDALQRLRWAALALAVVAAAYLGLERERLWYPGLSVLSTATAEDSTVDQALRADIAAPDPRLLVVVQAADREAALQGAERAGERLDRLTATGVIGGYDSPAHFLPSQTTQDLRRASLPGDADLRNRLAAALAGLPLAAGKLDGFLSDVATARRMPNIGRHSLDGSGLALAVDSLLMQRDGGWSALLPLRPPSGAQHRAVPAAALRAALAGTDALFIDLGAEFDDLYNDYLHEAVRLSLAGMLAIALLLALSLRSSRRLGAVLLPLLIANILVIAGLHLFGERLHLLHLVGMLLVVAVGSNYALFFDRLAAERDPATLASLAVANLTTAIGFGTLALSQVPVLHAIGVTVGPAAILSLLLSAIFVPRQRTR